MDKILSLQSLDLSDLEIPSKGKIKFPKFKSGIEIIQFRQRLEHIFAILEYIETELLKYVPSEYYEQLILTTTLGRERIDHAAIEQVKKEIQNLKEKYQTIIKAFDDFVAKKF
jgi:hypothetical protein